MINNAFKVMGQYFRGLFAKGYNNQYRYGTRQRRTRIPGKPGKSGDKLARMAREKRLGLRHS